MALNPVLLKSIETLGYRVTVGDVAAQAGLDVNLAQQGLLALASEAKGNLQVSDSGEIIYLFPRNFRAILRNKYWQLRLKEWWEKVWKVLFYLIRISFGIILIASVLLMFIAVLAIVIASMFTGQDNDSNSGSSSDNSSGSFFWIPNFFWIFDPGYNSNYYQRQQQTYQEDKPRKKQMNFLEAVFSFLFGDGNPNLDLEQRRWQIIGSVIRNNKGAVVAQQLAPFLDNVDQYNRETEDYILPVLTRFNGYPEVSPQGSIIYYFPDIQITAKRRKAQPIVNFLKEKLWRFSEADSGQVLLAIGIGVFNFVLALVLGYLLQGQMALELGSFITFVHSIYWILLGYAYAFLSIPLIRYFVNKWRNQRIESRNQTRQERADFLNQLHPDLQEKIQYARQFAAEKVITDKDITYSTEQELLEQEIERSDKIDEEWRRRLDGD